MGLYDRDFHAWANEQAALARSRAHNGMDWDNVAEELEGLGKQQQSELKSRYEVLLMHLLRWLYQPEGRGRSWRNTIRIQRRELATHLRKNPSVKAADAELFVEAYDRARLQASTETDLDEDVFPGEPPFTREQTLDEAFWPERDGSSDARIDGEDKT